NSGLELIIRQRQLSGARISMDGWYLRQARFNFIDRWGEPTTDSLDSDNPSLVWALGWLTITVSEQVSDGKPRLNIDISREDIESRLVQSSVKRNVFKLLETDQSADELWKKAETEKKVHATASSTTPPQATVSQPQENPEQKPAPANTIPSNQVPATTATAINKPASKKETGKNTAEEKIKQEHLDQLYQEALKNRKP
ncbi:MAG: hypothetical protein HRU15_16980, partial [Planctomycetes bacterium]|nr:hypothetical protein [Planctomycetota bacterium]